MDEEAFKLSSEVAIFRKLETFSQALTRKDTDEFAEETPAGKAKNINTTLIHELKNVAHDRGAGVVDANTTPGLFCISMVVANPSPATTTGN